MVKLLEYLRNNLWTPRIYSRLLVGLKLPNISQNQFGGARQETIKKDKLFFFANL